MSGLQERETLFTLNLLFGILLPTANKHCASTIENNIFLQSSLRLNDV